MLPGEEQTDTYPFQVPTIRTMDEMAFRTPVTIFVGENGTGKSTLLEALAVAAGSITVGAESVRTDPALEPARRLAKALKLEWRIRTTKGFFLRAEDFINFTRNLSATRTEMERRLREIDDEYEERSAYAKSLAQLPMKRSLFEMTQRYGDDFEANSHGEQFFQLFQSRFIPGGLYLLDEPETPLSPMKQLAFISMLKEMVDADAQFLIATHSPILMAFPGAEIYSFDQTPVQQVGFDDLEHVNLTRAFLNNPEQFLRHL